jgi:hypothetical protein
MTSFRRAALFGPAIFMHACLVGSPVRASDNGMAALQGAWVQVGLACQDTFVKKGKALDFKLPIDVFAPTFIVAGQRLRTPQAVCRIAKITSSGARHTLSLSCTTSVSVQQATAQLSIGADGKLSRYFGTQDPSGSQYEKCSL